MLELLSPVPARLVPVLAVAALLVGCGLEVSDAEPTASPEKGIPDMTAPDDATTALATLGAGCYWCVEAVLEQVDGVADVRSGFMGGAVADPSYEAVCSGTTGHAEVVQVSFDPAVISYEQVLDWFWRLHDPTTRDRQGNDVGSQYRSVIFTHDDVQQRLAEASKAAADASGKFARPIVTEIVPATTFFEASVSHQDYYRLNKRQPYCQVVIAPKLGKLGLEH